MKLHSNADQSVFCAQVQNNPPRVLLKARKYVAKPENMHKKRGGLISVLFTPFYALSSSGVLFLS